jgi:hypothetical protein
MLEFRDESATAAVAASANVGLILRRRYRHVHSRALVSGSGRDERPNKQRRSDRELSVFNFHSNFTGTPRKCANFLDNVEREPERAGGCGSVRAGAVTITIFSGDTAAGELRR